MTHSGCARQPLNVATVMLQRTASRFPPVRYCMVQAPGGPGRVPSPESDHSALDEPLTEDMPEEDNAQEVLSLRAARAGLAEQHRKPRDRLASLG